MNFRFQDEKETQGHKLLGDTCSEQGPMPKKGHKEELENRGLKEGHYIHSSIPLTFTTCVLCAWLCAKQQAQDTEHVRVPALGIILPWNVLGFEGQCVTVTIVNRQ